MITTINWGIIGCGNVTEIKSGPAFNRVPNSRLVAVMRRDAALAEDYARRHDVPRWYDDATALLHDGEVNAIYIATPPASHEAYVMAALERGLPVYVEKPSGIDAAAAQRVATAAAEKGAKVSVAHYRRKLPVFEKVKSLLEAGAIGTPGAVQLTLWKHAGASGWRVQPELSGGGHFHDLSPHQLDILLHYFGTPLKYEGLPGGPDLRVPDTVSGQILFPGNVLCNGSWHFSATPDTVQDSCIISGSRGSIRFSFFRDFDYVTLHNENGTETFRFSNPVHVQEPLIAAVVQYFRGEGPNPCTAADAALGMQIMETFTTV